MSVIDPPPLTQREQALKTVALARDDEAATLREENARLRELYDNQRNLAKQGWTIDHLMECEEALSMVTQDAMRYRSALVAVRSMIDPHNPCHQGLREALLDALGGDDGE